MIRKLMLAAAAPVVLMAAAAATGSAEGSGLCDPAGGVKVETRLAGPEGGIAVVHGRTLALVGPLGRRTLLRFEGEGLVRHPALGGAGRLAYVADPAGPDLLHVVGDPASPIEGGTELTHPAWSPAGALAWAEDLERLRLRTPDGELRDLGRPPGTEGVFSPVFPEEGMVIAVAIEPAAAGTEEDAALDNLWELDLATGAWRRRTAFAAHGDSWSVLRTPVAMADGSLRFVRLAGSAGAGPSDAAELWALDPGGPRLLRPLPTDAVLAGRLGNDLVLNLPELETGEHRLIMEGAGMDLGCGTAMADPLIPPDPDLVDGDEGAGGEETPAVDEPLLSDGDLAIVVGDFETRGGADVAASELTAAGRIRVLTHDDAPGAVAPGVWAVAVGIPEGVPVEEALATFRARFPQHADRSWITAP